MSNNIFKRKHVLLPMFTVLCDNMWYIRLLLVTPNTGILVNSALYSFA